MTDGPPPRRALALTWRLVAGYTLVALLTLSVAAFVLHRGLRRSFEIEDGEVLSESVSAVRREVLRHPGDLHEASEIILHLAGDRQIEKYYARLLDENGRVIVETPGGGEVIPDPAIFPEPAAAGQFIPGVSPAKSPNGNPAWLAAALVARAPGETPLVYQIAMDTRHVEAWLREYRHDLTLMVAGATAATALLGWFITRRSLRPLKEITATAQRITASGLDGQIGCRVWPGELASLATEFDRMLSRLRESFDRLSQFTADAAHEFRTPLNNLMGGTSLALARPRSAEDYRAILEANLEEYHRLSHMMDSLLFLARADNAQTVLQREPVVTAETMHQVVDFFSALAEERDVHLTCAGEASLTADSTLLRMALTNLVSNALRHAPGGTAVSLKAEENDGTVILSVRNEGPGIPAEHLSRVFDRFYRAEESRANTSGYTGGSGLGLALVKTIMRLHGGSAMVESIPGTETIFRLHFPPRANG